jgi:PAS domain S-box-containing protein
MIPADPNPSLSTLLRRNLLVAAGYFLAGVLGLLFAIPPGHASAVWPPSGLALAAVLVWGPAMAPGIFVGALAANLRATWSAFSNPNLGLTLAVAVGIACGSTLQALVISWLLSFGETWREFLTSGKSALRFVLLAGPLGCIISATCGMGVLWAANLPPTAGLWTGWLTWWLGDVVGVLLVTPFAFMRQFHRPERSISPWPEWLGTFALIAGVGALIFHNPLPGDRVRLPIAHAMLPPVIWAVHRFGLRGSLWTNLMAALITVWGTARGLGPFSGHGLESGLMLLDAYMLTFLSVSLVLGATADENRRSRDQLTVANRELEHRYAQQTSQVATTAAALTAERDFTATLMEITAALVTVVDRDFRIIRFNRACELLSGYSAAEVDGRVFTDFLLPADQREAVTQVFADLQNGVVVSEVENDWVTRSGEYRRILWSNATMTDAEGRVAWIVSAGIDITRIRLAERELQESQRKLAALLDNLPGMAYRCRNDRAWTMEFVSDGVKALTGHPAEALYAGQPISYNDLIDPDDREWVWLAVQQGVTAHQPFELTYRIHRADGEIRWVWEQGNGVFDEQGELLAIEGLVTDITDRRQFEHERDQLVQDLQEALRVRQEFLSVASHELKTPITSLRLAVQRLLSLAAAETLTPERLERNLDTIERQSRRLGILVESLLDVTRIQAGRLQLHPEAGDLGGVIHDVVARLEPDASRAGSTVTVSAAGPLPGHWDRHRLDQVLTNLLSNAIKYGLGRPIIIEAHCDGTDCHIAVIDQGIGIPAQDQVRVFAPFERAVSSDHYGGLGLGLYIVQRIVVAHGGDIWADSGPDGGTTMHLRLPQLPAGDQAS